MRMQKLSLIAILSLAVMGFSGCASTPTTGGAPAGQPGQAAQGAAAGAGQAGGASATAAQPAGTFTGNPLDNPNSPLAKRTFYFDFDSSRVADADHKALEAHANYLIAHPEVSIELAGHTDERGTREYNLALGERRAKAVEGILTLLGVPQKQIRVISFGEEQPVALGHNEAAWRLNRRVELIYSGY